MRKSAVLPVLFMILFHNHIDAAENVTVSWNGTAEKAYDTGFARNVMRYSGNGVSLFNMELIENDAPGAGNSEKGTSSDFIWGDMRGRKILELDDPRAGKAWIVIFVYNGFTNKNTPKYPLKFSVNGNESSIDPWDFKKVIECYRWVEFPAGWLKKGKNIIDLFCPEAVNEEEGWELYISRADEFEPGGGDPKTAGESSFKSVNGGKSWQKGAFGPDKDVRAEYTVRLSLDRYVKSGWLETPVIDLWKGDSEDRIIPLKEIKRLNLTLKAEVPDGTTVDYYIRKGIAPGPFSEGWGSYEQLGSGSDIRLEINGAEINRRYIQIKAELTTANPLVSPVVESIDLSAELTRRVPVLKNVFVVDAENDPIKYSSIGWEWESFDRPEFGELKKRENLDEVIAVSRTEFDAQVKILDYVAKRWKWALAPVDFPGWDALSVLGRLESLGAGGNCITFNNTIGGMCMAYGWQARLVNMVGHEVVEVWNDDFGKWILLDGSFDPDNGNTYQYALDRAEPLNSLELHNYYLDYYFPGKTIDWMRDYTGYQKIRKNDPPPVARGTLAPEYPCEQTGFITAAFMRMVPRNNWFEQPTPRPLNHGSSFWPWNGYINWYDSRTPPKRQYSWHTDRPRDMWPDLNKVFVHMTSGFGNDRLFLRFESYTPNFSHFEVDADDTGWKQVSDRWTWLLQSGRNTLRVRAVNKSGAKGKPSRFVVNHADAPFGK